MENIKLGSRVMMKPGNQYWEQNNKNNPKHEEGTIDHYYSEGNVTVVWDGGGHNSYETKDLQLVTAETYQIY